MDTTQQLFYRTSDSMSTMKTSLMLAIFCLLFALVIPLPIAQVTVTESYIENSIVCVSKYFPFPLQNWLRAIGIMDLSVYGLLLFFLLYPLFVSCLKQFRKPVFSMFVFSFTCYSIFRCVLNIPFFTITVMFLASVKDCEAPVFNLGIACSVFSGLSIIAFCCGIRTIRNKN